MPTVNVFINDGKITAELEKIIQSLKEFVAQQLTCGDINLNSDEVSVRFLQSSGPGVLANVELEITAAAFKERVEKQDEICLNVQKFILENVEGLADVKVWLILSELGHSWK